MFNPKLHPILRNERMLRIVAPLFRAAGVARAAFVSPASSNFVKFCHSTNQRCLSTVSPFLKSTLFSPPLVKTILPAVSQPIETQSRTVTKFSLRRGKRKTNKEVIKRFFRLYWGGWIRTRAGRHKKLWKKSPALKRRLRQHVFINSTQCSLLDKLVTSYWRKPRYYVDDPYAPYHSREEFMFTRRNPRY